MFNLNSFRVCLILNGNKQKKVRDLSICVPHLLCNIRARVSLFWHNCSDTEMIPKRWAISLLLELWGWRRTCLSVRTKKKKRERGDDRVSHHLQKFSFNSHTQTHRSSRGKKKNSQREAKHLCEQWEFSQMAQKLWHKASDIAPGS